ncbi:MAG: ArsC/Spx/MgsR family protein [Pseudomonadota bacterium]
MTVLTLYGLPTCDACRKARKALEASGRTVTVRDIRAEPLSADEWQPLLTEFGDRLVNKKSTTWRGLSDWMQASEAEDQLAQHPALMKRPVLSDGSKMTLGWDAETQAAWGV